MAVVGMAGAEEERRDAVLEVGPYSGVAQAVGLAWRHEHREESCQEYLAMSDSLGAHVDVIAVLRQICQPSPVLAEIEAESLDSWKVERSRTWYDLGLVSAEVAAGAAMIAWGPDGLVAGADGIRRHAQEGCLNGLEVKLDRNDGHHDVSDVSAASDHK